MLVDYKHPYWVRFTTPKVIDPQLASFIAFAETKPADEEYCWYIDSFCAAGQWLRSIGDINYRLSGTDLNRLFGGNGAKVFLREPHTWGAARMRALSLTAGL
jgi:hypothetical protein